MMKVHDCATCARKETCAVAEPGTFCTSWCSELTKARIEAEDDE